MTAVDLTGLRAFHAVAQAGGFTAAARARNVSQPTLSAQVRALEDQHGVRLFDRVGRSIRLTEVGQSLFIITTRLLAAEGEATDFLAGIKALTRGHLRIAADSARHVMPVLARFKTAHPGLTYNLMIGNSTAVLDQVLDYAADVAITARRTADPRFHTTLVKTDRLIGFVNPAHPLADRQAVSLHDLTGHDLVLRERGSVTREVFENRLNEAGVQPGSLLEVQSREAVHEAVVAGLGLGVVFENEFRSEDGLLRLVFAGVDMAVAEYAVCLEERRRLPLVRTFLLAMTDAQP